MDTEEKEVDTLNQEEQVDSEETTEEVESEESVEDLKAKLVKAEEVAKNQKIRAEKAEKEAKEKKVNTEELSSIDILAITRANISDEDLDYVRKFAKIEGVSVSEALKSEELKEILKVKEEKRATAQASNVTVSKRGSSKVSDEDIVSNANQGKMPDDPAELATARMRLRMKSK